MQHSPDILDCLANLSSDEVFTPPALANKMLDHLPERVWGDPSLKWLDPCTKSGVFLREAARRLMKGLESAIPDFQDRREHIYRNMLYGIAISELTSLISRRTLYHCKDASLTKHSIVRFDNSEGNIRFPEVQCKWKDGKCIHCGVSRNMGQVAEGREAHIHPFLHMDLGKIFEKDRMKFNIIMGNPPYQMQDAGHGKSAGPLYHRFVQKAKEAESDFLTFVIPARWYAGGKGLDNFRAKMLSDQKISLLADYPRSDDVFPDVTIAGGVCWFLRDRHHQGDCLVLPNGDTKGAISRELDTHEVFVRDSQDVTILEKVQAKVRQHGWETMSSIVRPRNFYGLPAHQLPLSVTNKPRSSEDVLLITREGDRYISRNDIHKNLNTVDCWKVIMSRAGESGGGAGSIWTSCNDPQSPSAPSRQCLHRDVSRCGLLHTTRTCRQTAGLHEVKPFSVSPVPVYSNTRCHPKML